VTLKNREPTYIVVLAEKIRDDAPTAPLQQSDYAVAWDSERAPAASNGLTALVKNYLPKRAIKLAGGVKYRVQYGYRSRAGFEGKPYFRRFIPYRDALLP
jgi:hypothetical protein